MREAEVAEMGGQEEDSQEQDNLWEEEEGDHQDHRGECPRPILPRRPNLQRRDHQDPAEGRQDHRGAQGWTQHWQSY